MRESSIIFQNSLPPAVGRKLTFRVFLDTFEAKFNKEKSGGGQINKVHINLEATAKLSNLRLANSKTRCSVSLTSADAPSSNGKESCVIQNPQKNPDFRKI